MNHQQTSTPGAAAHTSVFVIAEAGVNHNGSLDTALQLVDVAAEAGADAVKFQTFKAEALATATAAMAAYQATNLQADAADTQLNMLKQLELSVEAHHRLVQHCRQRQIQFMSTAFDAQSLGFLATLDMPALKIPSGDITAGPLLLQAAQLRKRMIVSTGMSTLADVEAALGLIAYGLTHDTPPRSRGDFEAAYASTAGQVALRAHVTLLHCVSQYPAPAHSINLRCMDTLASAFGLPVGYSDHTLGLEIALAAVARGACVLEKHFTLDRRMPGPDHVASLEPGELRQLVEGVRRIEQALGSTRKGPVEDEIGNRAVVRRSLVAARPISRGTLLSAADLGVKRPAHGLSPMQFWDTLGRPAKRDYQADELIEP